MRNTLLKFAQIAVFITAAVSPARAVPAGVQATSVPLATVGIAGGVGSLDALGRAPLSQAYIGAGHLVPSCYSPGNSVTTNNYSSFVGASGEVGETTRILCQTNGPVQQVALYIGSRNGISGADLAASNWVFVRASLEYPINQSGSPPAYFQSMTGGTVFGLDPNSSGLQLPTLGAHIPPKAQYAVRLGTFVVVPPSALAAATGGNGFLGTGVTRFYKETCVYFYNGTQVESGPSAEASVTTSAANSANTLTATATTSPLKCAYYNVYEGSTAGSEVYLGQTSGPTLSFVDNGTMVPQTGVTPPAAQVYLAHNFVLSANVWSNTVFGGPSQSGLDLTAQAGTSGLNIHGPASYLINYPAAILTDDVNGASGTAGISDKAYNSGKCGLGDSIEAGSGILPTSAVNGNAFTYANWFMFGSTALAGYSNVMNLSLSSTEMGGFTGANPLVSSATAFGVSERTNLMAFCDDFITDLGTNDLNFNANWQTIAYGAEQIGRELYLKGKYFAITTLLPRSPAVGDLGMSIAGQSPISNDADRQAYNSWARGGMLLSSATFTGSIAPGTAAGTATFAGTTMTVSACTTCTFAPGLVSGSGVVNLRVLQQIAGTTGGIGTYQLDEVTNLASRAIVENYGILTVSGLSGTLNTYELIQAGAGQSAALTPFTEIMGGSGSTFYVNQTQTIASEIMTGTLPVLSGGTATPWLTGVCSLYGGAGQHCFDLAAAMGEVNAADVPTANGGYWPAPCITWPTNCPGAPVATATVGAGATTATIPYTGWSGSLSNAQNAAIEYTVADITNQTYGFCIISANSTTTLTCNGNVTAMSTAPTAGDTIQIWKTSTQDYIHPHVWIHAQIATPFATWEKATFP